METLDCIFAQLLVKYTFRVCHILNVQRVLYIL